MSAAGKGSGAAPKDDKDKTVAQVTGGVIAAGIIWSLYKSFRGRTAAEKDVVVEETEVKKLPSKSGAKLDKQYEVAKGDTLWSISRRYGITVEDVKDANGIADVNFILPGDSLVIPHWNTTLMGAHYRQATNTSMNTMFVSSPKNSTNDDSNYMLEPFS